MARRAATRHACHGREQAGHSGLPSGALLLSTVFLGEKKKNLEALDYLDASIGVGRRMCMGKLRPNLCLSKVTVNLDPDRSPPPARRAATRRGDRARSSTTSGPASSRPAPARRPPSAAPVSPRPSLLSYFALATLAGDEHHQVFPPLGTPFLLREAVRPNPNILFVFRSESNYKCICMCYAC